MAVIRLSSDQLKGYEEGDFVSLCIDAVVLKQSGEGTTLQVEEVEIRGEAESFEEAGRRARLYVKHAIEPAVG